MTSEELRELGNEVIEIPVDNPAQAIRDLQAILGCVIDHLYFRQQELERRLS